MHAAVPKLELFGGELLAIDGSKFGAVNARDQNFNALKLQDLIDQRTRGWRSISSNWTVLLDAAETDAATLSKTELGGEDRGVAGTAGLAQGTVGSVGWGAEQISANRPDTRKMPTAHGMVVGCDAQMAVDAKHEWMAAEGVTNEGTDYQQLANVALEAKTNLALTETEVLADAGYCNASEVSSCVEQQITPYLPKADTSANHGAWTTW